MRKTLTLFCSVALLSFGLSACTQTPTKDTMTKPDTSTTVTMAKPNENLVLEKSIDGIAYTYVRSQLAKDNPKAVPGAQIAIMKDGQLVFNKSYGVIQAFDFANNPPTKVEKPIAVTNDTLFDLASVTKISATTQAMMHLVYEGKIKLDDKVATYLPDFAKNGKENVTIGQLLSHTSGLPQWKAIYLYANTREKALEYIENQPLMFETGTYKYSDLGFMTLAFVIEKITNQPFDTYVEKTIYEPLGLKHTMFNPLSKNIDKNQIAVTSYGNPYELRMIDEVNYPNFGYDMSEDKDAFDKFMNWRQVELQGEVNDGNAGMANEGIAGHAGLFSTASDLAKLYQVLLDKGKSGQTVLYDETVLNAFLEDVHTEKSGTVQAYGFIKHNAWLKELSDDALGHNGFTGTYVTISPKENIVIILLTNKMNNGQKENGAYNVINDFAASVNYTVKNIYLEKMEK
ncbi:serine hydrolase [Carnobacteriaceae bacterium zg-ZUI78]|nr:serine hydrolase [Carnobacteriaceae bacterium zg-ZUI78]